MIFIIYFYYLDDKRFSLIIPFSSPNQLAQNVRESGLRVARTCQGLFDQSEGKFKIAMTWQRGEGLPQMIPEHAKVLEFVDDFPPMSANQEVKTMLLWVWCIMLVSRARRYSMFVFVVCTRKSSVTSPQQDRLRL